MKIIVLEMTLGKGVEAQPHNDRSTLMKWLEGIRAHGDET